MSCVYYLFWVDAISIFKTGWCTCDHSWHQSELASIFEVLLNIRHTFHSAITSSSPRDHDVVIQTKSEDLLNLLQVREYVERKPLFPVYYHLHQLFFLTFGLIHTLPSCDRPLYSVSPVSIIGNSVSITPCCCTAVLMALQCSVAIIVTLGHSV